MISNCFHCNKEFEKKKNKIYCSNNCREKEWYNKKGKETKSKYQKGKKFRNYQNKWRRNKKYWLKQYENNKKGNREKAKKYRDTPKGKVNYS